MQIVEREGKKRKRENEDDEFKTGRLMEATNQWNGNVSSVSLNWTELNVTQRNVDVELI